MEGIEPRHKLTSAEKKATDYVENVVRYYTKQANLLAGDKAELQILYDAAEGKIDLETYKYVLNPYNTNNDDLKKFPARLRNYDIITPVLKLWLGEMSKRPNGATVFAINPDTENQKKDFIKKGIQNHMLQDFVNNLKQMGLETEMEEQEIEAYQSKQAKLETTFDHMHATTSQEALNFLKYSLNLDDKVQKLFNDWIICGRFISYKDVYMDDVEYEPCDPRDVYVMNWGNSDYIEDADGVVRVRRLSSNSVLDLYFDEIHLHKDKEDILTWLDTEKSLNTLDLNTIELRTQNIDKTYDREGQNARGTDDSYIRVYHVVWKSFTKVGILRYLNELGQPEQMEVDDTYKLEKSKGDIAIEWLWINEVWEATQLEDKYILGGGPILVQRNALNNPSICKLPYNGRILGYRNTDIQSPVKAGLNYQVLYNIFHYRFELLLAKNKDKLLAMPLSLLPDGDGWDTDKFMHWIAADGMLFYDDAKPKIAALLSGIKSIDMGLGNYMDKMWQHMVGIKQEWWDEIGMNRQRYGDSFASDGKGNTEQAIFRSSIQTADMYRQFDKTLETDYEGLLDYSKLAWINGKKGMYINSDRRKVFLTMNEEDVVRYMSSEFGVFVGNTTEELENLERAKNLLQTMGQNGLGAEYMIGILNAKSISKVQELAKEGTAIEREFQQQQTQQVNETNQAIQEAKSKDIADKNATTIQVAQISADASIEVALIQADASLVDILNNTGELEEDSLSGEAIGSAVNRLEDRNSVQKQLNEAQKEISKKEDRQLKREKMANDLKIAKENKN